MDVTAVCVLFSQQDFWELPIFPCFPSIESSISNETHTQKAAVGLRLPTKRKSTADAETVITSLWTKGVPVTISTPNFLLVIYSFLKSYL